MAQPCAREAGHAGIQQDAVDVTLVLLGGSPRKGERGWPQVKIEQAISQARLVVVVALRLSGRDNLDLSAVQAEALVDRANLRFGRLRVRQEDATCAAFDNGRRNARILDVGQALRSEDHR